MGVQTRAYGSACFLHRTVYMFDVGLQRVQIDDKRRGVESF
jgi:hypothetical protein